MRISAYLEPSGTVLWNRPDIVRDAEVAGSNPVASIPWQGAGCPVDIRSAPTEAERRCRKPRELEGFRFFYALFEKVLCLRKGLRSNTSSG